MTLEQLYREHAAAMTAAAARVNRTHAEDATHDVFARLARRPDLLNRIRPATAGRYLTVCARRAAIARNRPDGRPLRDTDPDPLELETVALARLELADMLHTGGRREREARVSLLLGLTRDQQAHATGRSVRAVDKGRASVHRRHP